MKNSLTLVTALLLACSCAAAKKGPPKVPPNGADDKAPFDLAAAPARLHHPGARVARAEPQPGLPGLWVVILEGPGAGDHAAYLVFPHAGHAARGYKAAGLYLRQERVLDKPPGEVLLLRALAGLGALPREFGESLGGPDPLTGEKGKFTASPFELRLVTSDYHFAPEPGEPGAAHDGPPTDSPLPSEGPGGPGPGGPGPGGPGAGPAAPSLSSPGRAVLRGDASYHFVWTVERYDRASHAWHLENRIPLQ